MRAFGLAITTVFALAALAAPASATDTAKKSAGQELFEKYKCQSCHSIATLGIEKKKAATEDAEEAAADKTEKKAPPDLSGVGVSHKADWMAAFLMKKEKTKEGKLHTKKFKGTAEELKKVTAWLETLKDAKAAEKANVPKK
jgi:mono/diheme cytochrome c family protein